MISPRGPFIFILENKCNGYTWHGKLSNRISNVCVLFDTTSPDGSYECSNCISGQIDKIEENCNCQKQYGGECLITNNNFLSAIVAYSNLECFIQCSATDGCLFYTWYRSVEFLLVIFDEIDAKFHQLNQKSSETFLDLIDKDTNQSHAQGCRPWGCHHGTHKFCPIHPTNNTGTPGFSDLPTADGPVMLNQ